MNARRGLLLAALLAAAPGARAELYYVIVGGLGGNPEYDEAFATHAHKLGEAAERTLGGDARVSVLVGSAATREALRARLTALAARTKQSDRLAVFLVGHGSYDGTQYKFNLPGPDIDGAELAELLGAIPARAQLVVNATSASGAVLENWAKAGRAVITATRSGAERNATRFAEYFAAALSADEADVNKNGMITAQEAFDYTARRVADSYEAEGTLATEHPQLKGDNLGSFEIARLKAPAAVETPEVVELNAQRAALEERIAELRLRREELGENYLPQLEALLVELARVQERIDAAGAQ
ncbi:MAG TPA: hypothetical protein VIC71_03160 [Gammaproteobacteria bacterium]